jgi:hypothetical protein
LDEWKLKTWNKTPDSVELVNKDRFGPGTNVYLCLDGMVALDDLDGGSYDLKPWFIVYCAR